MMSEAKAFPFIIGDALAKFVAAALEDAGDGQPGASGRADDMAGYQLETAQRLADDAKVEFHGCKTAESPSDEDNIAADFSKCLCETGKTKSTVIGHVINATPAIDGEGKTESKAQDYRDGPRAIFKNSKLTRPTSQKGMLDEADLSK